ncbi:aspartyl/glutamyl-tRNA(Asn/Gln) amidotransferase subunit B [Hypnocyclicus thermotrophus]|uniref:Aspartyl/glutamyl-tRNA(Asn/Gln) amidotransferase subunit B n=1 Tax=Hypnocyclicus thermotrophus TaxID=1627895 RepID=A0AA46I5M7_9FUSO|nr:Asp-tRNA(Asn)/Glu-tRNA(Gln) amidotransferase subunit GatB [Hypnocyclicus thermotrophus]TDT69105.1 aspartyl/glutamyl-tRNA(Asn/Gln) amidotransferase subunit B [Hypnocyclicus thermotrophus]
MAREWEAVIGLEVHCQLKTGTKVWCGCSTDYDNAKPNTHVCPICLGHPGVLPKLNEKVLDYAIKAGLALNCDINKESKFDRKNYFYPDTPKNYQITQFDKPYAENGYLDIKLNSGREKRIGITRIHIEEDAGKSIHTTNESFVNFNRASMPLIEIVSEPDIRTPEEAYEYLNTLKTAIKYTGISDVSMELGSLRCDANVSVREKGTEKFGTRTETKNLNSFKAVAKAIEYEIGRQIELIENGGVVEQETLLWDEANGVTRVMRSKEEANDYRYFPEPDLVKVIIDNDRLERLKAEMPESKIDKVKRFIKEYDLKEKDAEILSNEIELADYFEQVAKYSNNSKSSSNWIITEVLRVLKEENKEITDFSIRAEHLAKIIKLIDNGTISSKIAKKVFEMKLTDSRDPEEIVKVEGLTQVSDSSEIEKIVDEVIANNPKMVEDYKQADEGRKPRVLKGLMGQVMKITKGKANPKLVTELFEKKL